MRNWSIRCGRFFSSNVFYWAVLAVFVIEALWIALSARYPMAFDENYHFGLIRLYSHQFSPFFSREPVGASIFGDVTRYPSYLYHYLMSFPYRGIAFFIKNTANQIVALRLLNIAFFTAGLIFWRKALRLAKFPNAIINLSLLVLVLLPQIPFLAGQINYDNLLFLLIAVNVGLAIKLNSSIKDGQLDPTTLLWLLTLSLLASLVKYTYLPIFVGLIGYFSITCYRTHINLSDAIKGSWKRTSKSAKITVIICLIISGGLFTERYGYNIAHFHNVVPDCGKVIGTEACLDYGPWARNYGYAQTRPANYPHNPFGYTYYWSQSMFHQLFFVLAPDFTFTNTFPLPNYTSGLLLLVGLLALVRNWRIVLARTQHLVLLLALVLTYLFFLWLLNFVEYLHLAVPVAIQGRYLIPILPIVLAVLGLAVGEQLSVWGYKKYLPLVGVAIVLIFLQGGGGLTFIAKTNPSFWWPNATVIHFNQTAQKILRPLIIP